MLKTARHGTRTALLAIVTMLLVPGAVEAADDFYDVAATNLRFSVGSLPHLTFSQDVLGHPYATLEGDGEVYVDFVGRLPQRQFNLHFRVPAGQTVRGRLFHPRDDGEGMMVLRFELPRSTRRACRDRRAPRLR